MIDAIELLETDTHYRTFAADPERLLEKPRRKNVNPMLVRNLTERLASLTTIINDSSNLIANLKALKRRIKGTTSLNTAQHDLGDDGEAALRGNHINQILC